MHNFGKSDKYKLRKLFYVSALCVTLSVILTGCNVTEAVQTARQRIAEKRQEREKITNDIEITDGQEEINSQESVSGDEDARITEIAKTPDGESEHGDDSKESSRTKSSNDGKPALNSTIKLFDTYGELVEQEIAVIDETGSNNETAEDKSKEIKASELNDYSSECIDCYAYSQLSKQEQQIYREIYSIVRDFRENVVLSSKDTDKIDHAFKCVMVDHPEIFYVKGYSIGKFIRGKSIDRITLKGTYTMTKAQAEEKAAKVDRYITNVIKNAPQGDDYDIIKYVYEYLIYNTEYDDSALNNQNILSIVDSGKTVCQGYAKMTQLILNRMGLFCTLVNGTAIGSNGTGTGNTSEWSSHVWNIVRSNGRYYIVDTTWGDATFTINDDEGGSNPKVDINYEFLMVKDSDIVSTHNPSPVVNMPECVSDQDNYYVREGCYFSYVNQEQLQLAFDRFYADGKLMISIKMQDDNVYDDMKQYLFEDQNIFKYIAGDSVKYVEYPERNMMLITL